jgi:hypothetical protein
MPAREYETGSLTIAVMQSDAFGIEFQPHSHPIALHVDDVEAARGELEAKGIEFRADNHGQRRLPHGALPRSRRQRADAAPPVRAQGREAHDLEERLDERGRLARHARARHHAVDPGASSARLRTSCSTCE